MRTTKALPLPTVATFVEVCSLLLVQPRAVVRNYRTARRYPLTRRAAFHWARLCADTDGVSIEGFLAECFRADMARLGMDDCC